VHLKTEHFDSVILNSTDRKFCSYGPFHTRCRLTVNRVLFCLMRDECVNIWIRYYDFVGWFVLHIAIRTGVLIYRIAAEGNILVSNYLTQISVLNVFQNSCPIRIEV
jgi:hypothetical protein